MPTNVNISEVMGSTAPFEEYGMDDESFRSVDSILDKEVVFCDAKQFENEKGPGVFIAFAIDKEYFYTATHSVGLVRVFSDEKVNEVFDRGDFIIGTIREKKSKKTGNKFYVLE